LPKKAKTAKIAIRDQTAAGWKKKYPWLVIDEERTESGHHRCHCTYCKDAKINNVWGNGKGSVVHSQGDLKTHDESPK
jgi:hypothetical protein